MVSPTKALNSSSDLGCHSSGDTEVILFKTYFMTSRVISTLSMSISYINTILSKGSLLNCFSIKITSMVPRKKSRKQNREHLPPEFERSEEHTSELQSRENLVC